MAKYDPAAMEKLKDTTIKILQPADYLVCAEYCLRLKTGVQNDGFVLCWTVCGYKITRNAILYRQRTVSQTSYVIAQQYDGLRFMSEFFQGAGYAETITTSIDPGFFSFILVSSS
jgi:hypothetical protein